MQLSEITPGQQLTWLHRQRGGYNWIQPVDAEVLKVSRTRVKVLVQRTSGEQVARWVDPANLRQRKEGQ